MDSPIYRRGKKRTAPVQDTNRAGRMQEPFTSRDNAYIPPEIGRGWPDYRSIPLPYYNGEMPPDYPDMDTFDYMPPGMPPYRPHSEVQRPYPEQDGYAGNEIIMRLTPIVRETLIRYGQPDSPYALKHLTDQVIAKAMGIREVGESIRTREMSPWGRATLLQTVIELMLRLYSVSQTIPS